MKKTAKILFVSLPLLLTTMQVASYNINPLNRNNSEEYKNSFKNSVSEPVHENITRKARKILLDNCNKQEQCTDESSLKTIQDSLIRGIWWNDDPNQNLYKGRQAVWLSYMVDAGRIAKSSNEIIDDGYMMQYRSHYGDMQFLHSMSSSDNETIEETRDKILVWAEFAYKISIGQIGKESYFSDLKEMKIHKYFERHSRNKWKIKWLLQPRYYLKDTENDFQKHALGTLLHMVQDSYSEGHTKRTFNVSEHCPYGSVEAFHNYVHQDAEEHKVFDSYSTYKESEFPIDLGPVDVSAQLIRYSMSKSDWTNEVLPFLKSKVYCI